MSTGLFSNEENGYNLEEETKYKLKLDTPKSEPAFSDSGTEGLGDFEDLGDDDLGGDDLGGSDKPFDDEPFDAGVEADEDESPEKFIQQLSGKLGNSLRKYSDERGEADFELEKFAINSVISATHTAEMDEDDQKDIIRKVKSSGADDDFGAEDDLGGDDLGGDDLGGDDLGGDDLGDDLGGDDLGDDLGGGLEEVAIRDYKAEEEANKPNLRVYIQNPNAENYIKEGDDRCTRIAKQKYDTWPSAYASGAVVRCRKGDIWKGLKEDDNLTENYEYENLKITEANDSLHKWFNRKGGEGSSSGWVDCNTCKTVDGKKKCKPCGREDGEDRAKYPACRPTPSSCKTKGKGKKWGKKSENESVSNSFDINELLSEAEYQGKEVKLGKPMRGDVKKFKVYVKNDKGNVVKVNFGDKNMEIKRDDPKRKKAFRARHNCSNPGPRWKARYWSCKMWSSKSVSDILSENNLKSSEKNLIFTENMNIVDYIKNKVQELMDTETEPKVKPVTTPIVKPSRRTKRIWEAKPAVQPKPKAVK